MQVTHVTSARMSKTSSVDSAMMLRRCCIAEELVSERLHGSLAAALAAQPAWSDLPILVVAQKRESSALRLPGLAVLGNVSVLDTSAGGGRAVVVGRRVGSRAPAATAGTRLVGRSAGAGAAQGRVPRNARARASQSAGADPLCRPDSAGDGLPADQLRDTAQLVERQVGHMATIIDDLLDVSRVTRGLITLSAAPLDFADLVRRTVDAYAVDGEGQGRGACAQ